MKESVHISGIKEALDEIEKAFSNSNGIKSYQRRLILIISTAVADLIELYFHKVGAIKSGAKIQHQWFQRNDTNLKQKLEQQIIKPIELLPNINKILKLARKIEDNRNALAYGTPTNEQTITERISLFLELKETIEKEIGGVV